MQKNHALIKTKIQQGLTNQTVLTTIQYELTPITFDMELTHLGSEASIYHFGEQRYRNSME